MVAYTLEGLVRSVTAQQVHSSLLASPTARKQPPTFG